MAAHFELDLVGRLVAFYAAGCSPKSYTSANHPSSGIFFDLLCLALMVWRGRGEGGLSWGGREWEGLEVRKWQWKSCK